MKLFVIGSGGREHVLVWKLNQSTKVEKLYCAPGNGGISDIAECVDIKANDIEGLLNFAVSQNIDLTVVGPEAPFVDGIIDVFESKGLKILGPSQKAAQLEGSKVFAKEFMKRHNIPTSDFQVFDRIETVMDFFNGLQSQNFPVVIKADGLAAGKGVMICNSLKEAIDAVDQIMKRKVFNEAGKKIVIEECLKGEEVSILALSDGQHFVILDSSQDHKRIFDGDQGPNTGGMGAYSPAPIVTKEMFREIESRIIAPTIKGMKAEGNTFKGVLYAGLMITQKGPYVLEFNVRFGDPEAQAVIPRLKNDLAELFWSVCKGELDKVHLEWDPRSCVCVVISSGGYPGFYEKGKEITGLELVKEDVTTFIFHAGTRREEVKIMTSGGRVLGIVSLGDDVEDAIKKVYEHVHKVKFEDCFFRRDIGYKALKKSCL